MTFPNSIYLSILSNPVQSAADFVISYRFNDRDPDEVIETLSEEERDKYLSRKVIVKQQKIYEDWTFWVLIAGGLIGLVIMIVLCVCLVNMKQRNDEITSKVVLMAQRNQRRHSKNNALRTIEPPADEGGPIASSKPFRDEEEEVAIPHTGGMVIEGSISESQKETPIKN